MKGLAALLLSIFVAMFCWGVYGPVLALGRTGMDGSSLRPFICVGIAYFLIAVLAPIAVLRLKGEGGHWSTSGIIWSVAAGAAGALGALGIILALAFGGAPTSVMPLVFGCAPVVNTFLTMYWSKSFKQVNPIFIAGLILVIVGAVTVLVFRPHHGPPPASTAAAATGDHPVATPARPELGARETAWQRYGMVVLFTAMTAISWGVYGPMLHRGQMAMAGSRLRPFLCVGVAYFLMAVIVPALILLQWAEPGQFTFSGSFWSLAGGAAGAVGALGIIMAFNFGGKPIFVMPLVFGGAPVVNTFVSVTQSRQWGELHAMFYAGLIVVMAGAVTVLIFSPKPAPHHPPTTEKPNPETAPA
jgi:drug/metabolite transporter (DMT)-like permease